MEVAGSNPEGLKGRTWVDVVVDVTVDVRLLQVRIWARRKALEERQGDYALNVTGRILHFYQRYYNAKYPLAKSGRTTPTPALLTDQG